MSDQDPSWPSEPDSPPPSSPPPSSSPPSPSSPPPSPPSPQDSSAAPATSGSASDGGDLGMRFAARLIDWVLLFLVNVVIGIIYAVVVLSDTASGNNFTGIGFGFSPLGLLTGLIPGAYFIVMEGAFGGKTVGKMLLGRQVEVEGGGEVDFERAFKREWWNLLSVIPFIGGLATAGFAIFIAVTINSGRGWHDEQAGTVVVATR